MKTQEITLYKFEELSEEAQKKAIDNYINSIDYIELDWLIWQFEDDAKEIGFENPKFQYSLSYSQGDGLSFSFSYFNSEKLREIIQEITGKNSNWFIDIIQNSIYSISGKGNKGLYSYAHEDQIDLRVDFGNRRAWNYYTNVNDVLNEIEAQIITLYMDLCSEFEKRAYEQIEYELSEENARFNLIEFENDFSENGELF